MIVNLSLDVEDVHGDPAVCNHVLRELCRFCEEQEIPCDLYITGIRHAHLRRHAPDLIAELRQARHVAVGFHSNTHSYLPIPVMTRGVRLESAGMLAEYEEQAYDWKARRFCPGQAGGLAALRADFPVSGFRAPNFAWTPAYLAYMARCGFAVTTMAIRYPGPFLFMGMLTLPVVNTPLEAMLDEGIAAIRREVAGYHAVSLYLHPSRLTYGQFWDKQPVRTLRPDWPERLERMKGLLAAIRGEHYLIGLRTLTDWRSTCQAAAGAAPDGFALLHEAMTGRWRWSQLPQGFWDDGAIADLRAVAASFRPVACG